MSAILSGTTVTGRSNPDKWPDIGTRVTVRHPSWMTGTVTGYHSDGWILVEWDHDAPGNPAYRHAIDLIPI